MPHIYRALAPMFYSLFDYLFDRELVEKVVAFRRSIGLPPVEVVRSALDSEDLVIGLFPQPFIKTAEPEIRYVAALAKDVRESSKEKQTTQHGLTDDRRAQMRRPLTEEEPDAARRGVDEDRVAGLHRSRASKKIFRGEPLQHHGRRGA